MHRAWEYDVRVHELLIRIPEGRHHLGENVNMMVAVFCDVTPSTVNVEAGGSFYNADNFLPENTASHPRRKQPGLMQLILVSSCGLL
jgi:hypothetical protein